MKHLTMVFVFAIAYVLDVLLSGHHAMPLVFAAATVAAPKKAAKKSVETKSPTGRKSQTQKAAEEASKGIAAAAKDAKEPTMGKLPYGSYKVPADVAGFIGEGTSAKDKLRVAEQGWKDILDRKAMVNKLFDLREAFQNHFAKVNASDGKVIFKTNDADFARQFDPDVPDFFGAANDDDRQGYRYNKTWQFIGNAIKARNKAANKKDEPKPMSQKAVLVWLMQNVMGLSWESIRAVGKKISGGKNANYIPKVNTTRAKSGNPTAYEELIGKVNDISLPIEFSSIVHDNKKYFTFTVPTEAKTDEDKKAAVNAADKVAAAKKAALVAANERAAANKK